MRKIGALLVLTGLVVAYLYPSFQTKFSGTPIHRTMVYERGRKLGAEFPVDMTVEQTPLKLRIRGKFLPDGAYTDNVSSFKVKVYSSDEVIVDEIVKLYHSPNSERDDDAQVNLVSHTPLFSITRPGRYTVEFLKDKEMDFNLSSLVITVLANAKVPNTSYRKPGIAAMVIGAVLFFKGRARRRKRKLAPADQSSPDIAKQAPKKKKIRWGRNADLD